MTNSFNKLNLYEILEVDSMASSDIIKKSYKKLLLKHHPDKNIIHNTLLNVNPVNSTDPVNPSDPSDPNAKFIKIKYAYDILIDPNKRKKYDIECKLNNYSISYDNFDLKNIFNEMKKIITNKEYISFVKIAEKKVLNNLSSKKDVNNIMSSIQNLNILSIINNVNNINFLDINLEVKFSLYQVFNNEYTYINYNRVTKNNFEEYIYPIDIEQIYENEGETVNINNKIYNGNMIIKINIIDFDYSNIKYNILNNDLYATIDKSLIINNNINFTYLDDKQYVHNLDSISKNITDFGNLYCISNIGLPYYDTTNNIIDIKDCKIKRGNLFFIIDV
jgi:curved DNA-binding protein CbpA